MQYIVFDEQRNGSGDIFTKEFESESAAVEYAGNSWIHLTREEQKKRTVYALLSVNPDEDECDHFDGNVIWQDGRYCD